MTTRIHTRPGTAPPYYLGRPAAFWLAALRPRPAARHRSDGQADATARSE